MNHQLHLRKQLEKHLIEKAVKDPVFRQQLIEHPKETIERSAGIQLPGSVQITVLEEGPQTAYLIIPPSEKETETNELTEQELTAIAAAGDGYSISGCEETYALFCK